MYFNSQTHSAFIS